MDATYDRELIAEMLAAAAHGGIHLFAMDAVMGQIAALRAADNRKTWWTSCVPNTDLQEANDEIGFMREDWQKVGEALGFTEFVDPEVIIAKIKTLTDNRDAAGVDADEDAYVIEHMGKLLAEIAVIVNGPEPDMTRWSYHDLPEKVRALKTAPAAVPAGEAVAWLASDGEVFTDKESADRHSKVWGVNPLLTPLYTTPPAPVQATHPAAGDKVRELVAKWRREADRLRAINAETDPDGKTFRYAECLREENAAQAGALTSCARALEAALAQPQSGEVSP